MVRLVDWFDQHRNRRNDRGFTVHEVLVVIVVGSVVLGLGLAALLFAGRMFSGWQARSGVKQEMESLARTILFDVLRSKVVMETSDTLLMFQLNDGRVISHRVAGGRVYRNGVPMTSENVEVSIRANQPAFYRGLCVMHLEIKGVDAPGEWHVVELTAGTKQSGTTAFRMSQEDE